MRPTSSRISAALVCLAIAFGSLSCTSDPLGIVIGVTPSSLVLDIGEEATLTVQINTFGGASIVGGASGWSSSSGSVEILGQSPGSFGQTVTVRGVSEGTSTVSVNVVWEGRTGLFSEQPTSGSETASAMVTVLPDPVSVTIEGVVQDTANGTGLADVFVQATGALVGGLPPVRTDGFGRYVIPVTEVDTYSMCAIGAIPATGIPQRFVNTNCAGEEVEVTSSSTVENLNLSVETGYHLAVMGCPCDYSGDANDPFSLTFDYRAWNRASVPTTTTWIAVGVEGDWQAAALGANAGPYGAPTAEASGTVTVDLTVPATATTGTYRIFARLVPVATAGDAEIQYESGFPAARERNYIQIGTVTVN